MTVVETIPKALQVVSRLKASSAANEGGTSKESVVGPAALRKGQEYELDHHLDGKSALIRELFEELDKFAFTLGQPIVTRF